jgi:glyoxylase-like metal-dependent hydrolase (beta-lactamase superfamily II)
VRITYVRHPRGLCVLAATLLLAMISPVRSEVDLSGHWLQRLHEDGRERDQGPVVGDYTGLPINNAARMRAETWDAAKWSVPEHQCEPHPADYAPHGPASMRVWSEVDPISQDIVAWHVMFMFMNSHQVIWMDGRPHPPPEAPHTWMGFSTGKWVGDTLVSTTTHLKEGWIRRNGVPRSDLAKLTEYWIRHEDTLTLVAMVEDPVYLAAPLVRSWNWTASFGFQLAPFNCMYRNDTGLPKGYVAHILPGKNTALAEFRAKLRVPLEAAIGGEATMYPEFTYGKTARLHSNRSASVSVDAARSADWLDQDASARGKSAPPRTAPRNSHHSMSAMRPQAEDTGSSEVSLQAFTSDVRVTPVQRRVYLVAGGGGNVVFQVGKDGVVVVDSGNGHSTALVLQAIRGISDGPIRHIVNTSLDPNYVGGNAVLAASGRTINSYTSYTSQFAPTERAAIYAFESVLTGMRDSKSPGATYPHDAWPTDTYFVDSMELAFNDEAIQILHQPNAISDGNSIVYFRDSDVITTGNLFLTNAYPRIDVENGGSIGGVIGALNRIIDLAIPASNQEGGTMIIPGEGRICDEYDVVMYRDMITIVRDRIQHLIKNGANLDQVVAAQPTQDFDPRYGTEDGMRFIRATYQSLRGGRR